MDKQTKIVATVSDQRCDVDFIQKLYNAGMNVVRMNTAHATPEGMLKIIENVRKVSPKIAILIDTKGPEVRTTACEGKITYSKGETIRVTGQPELETTHDVIAVNYPGFVKDVAVGLTILIDDGEIGFTVLEKHEDENYLLCEVQNDAELGSHKSVNVPGTRINLPALTDKDRRNIKFAIDNDLDFIAHSFVRSKEDIRSITEILEQYSSQIRIIAKIENQEGVDNIDEILEAADGIMIARGDLGIEVPQEKIPGIQRRLTRCAVLAHKPVIVATQMLHSMIKHPRPTRTEVTDIANAVYFRTDAVMLSGETAYGDYPVEAVDTMAKVVAQAEKDKLTQFDIHIPLSDHCDTTEFFAKEAVRASKKLPVKIIIVDSLTGRTARYVASFRGEIPVYALCYREETMRHLALSYGVETIYMPRNRNSQEYYIATLRKMLDNGVLKADDYAVYLSSGKKRSSILTSFMEINRVQDVLENADIYELPSKNRTME